MNSYLARALGLDTWSVVRWGGQSILAMREPGLTAMRLLSQGRSFGSVEDLLSARFGWPKGAKLAAFIGSLEKAGLVRSVDGVKVPTPRIRPLAALRFFSRFYFSPACRRFTRRVLPLSWGRVALHCLTRLDNRQGLMARARRATANARSVRGESAFDPRAFDREYYRHLVSNVVDIEALLMKSPAAGAQWMARHMEVEGLEHLDACLAEGRGVILAGFHFSSVRFISPALLTRGYSLSVTATPSPSTDLSEVVRWHNGLRSSVPSAGVYEQIPNVGSGTIPRLQEKLRGNEILFVSPDVHTIDPNQDAETETRCRFFGIERARFRPSRARVNLCGQPFLMSEWAGWLAAASGAPVVPAIVIRNRGGSLRLTLEAPLNASRSKGESPRRHMDSVNRELFGVLESWILRYPAQWFGWHTIDRLRAGGHSRDGPQATGEPSRTARTG